MSQPSVPLPNAPEEDSISASQPRYAEVAVPVHVFKTFLYQLPEPSYFDITVGARVVVPLGTRFTTGYIVGLHTDLPAGQSTVDVKAAREVLDATPVLTQELLKITRWVSDYYVAPWGEVIKAALPPGISPSITPYVSATATGRETLNTPDQLTSSEFTVLSTVAQLGPVKPQTLAKELERTQVNATIRRLENKGFIRRTYQTGTSSVREKEQKVVRLLVSPDVQDVAKTSGAQKRVLEVLNREQAVPLQELISHANTSSSVIRTLERKGVVEVYEQVLRRDPLSGESLPELAVHQLTKDQLAVLNQITDSLKERVYNPYLLHGVTGSGKTEIYIRAMRVALELGRSALMLVPEIALTPVFSRRLRATFGDQVAIFHSSLSRGERFDEWTRVRNGDARVVIGTRSAVFAPIENLGLVVIDEEHESTYRQQDSPHYSGRDTAIVRAQKGSAVVILGSATPSLESFHNARSGKYKYLQLPSRIGNRPMASAQLIDMRQVFDRHKKPRVFSDELLEAIVETHAKRQQSIVLLNRRGYSSFVLCRSCGETIECPNCDVTLTYHRSERVIICHYCNHRQPAPTQCPTCGGKYIYYVGEGTEQIEELLQKQFPDIRMARIDRDTTSRRRSFERTLHEFSEGHIDMLVGTQILAKGHDYPNVTLVGVVSVDAGLALPDFRAAERTFQLITQVAGRAGRGDHPGRVLIQTYHPEHYALRYAAAQDYAGFYNEEIVHRQNHGYPPLVALASLLVSGPQLGRVRADAITLKKELDEANVDRTCRVLGPAPAPLSRLKGEFRFQILIKSGSRRLVREVADCGITAAVAKGVSNRTINLDIDPVSIM